MVRSPARYGYIDVFRGLLIAHMALDHASLMFNAGRGGEELAVRPPEAATDLLQFLTRFSGVPVAPGFFFLAGFMVALTSAQREERGVSRAEVTRKLLVRGAVLIAVDTLIMGLPRALMGFYSFMVLSCIGVSVMMLALLRHTKTWVLLSAALAALILHPLLDVSALPVALRAVLYEPVRSGAFRSLYPIVPWSAIVVFGFVIGRDALSRKQPTRMWLGVAAFCALLFLAVRLVGGYGNAYSYQHVFGLEFWSLAKYPPDLAFLSCAFAVVFAGLALLRGVAEREVPSWLQPFTVFGRVAFFFYVVHFYVLGVVQAVLRRKFDLFGTYVIWAVLLVIMYGLCVWYARKKERRPNLVTRYL